MTTSIELAPPPSRLDLAELEIPPVPVRLEDRGIELAKDVSRSLLKSTESCRVAIAQISTDPGDITGNTQKIINCIQSAREKNVDLIVFHELAVTGYCCMDLLFNKDYLNDNLAAIDLIRQATQGITAVVGFVDTDPSELRSGNRPKLYNSAAIMHDGVLLGIQDKTLLPNYDIFFEDRYFEPPRSHQVIQAGKLRLATSICEDIWANVEHYGIDPVEKLVAQGADLILNLSASPFHLGKHKNREELVRSTARTHNIPVVYANLVGGFDGYEGEVIFDGRSVVASDTGELLGRGKAFSEELYIVDVHKNATLELPHMESTEELYQALVLGIKDYFRRICSPSKAGIDRAIIGLSGGIDSAVVAALAVDALGPEHVIGVTLPSQYSSNETRSDAAILAENLGIDFRSIALQGQVDACLEALRSDPELATKPEDVSEENVQARLRMIDLMYYANKLNAIVLNTGNKTELALNNCTIYGDMVGGFSVLGDVDKDRVYELARYINERSGKEIIPVSTIDRPPSAELKPNQTDDQVMGDTPQRLAPLVRTIIEQKLSYSEALSQFSGDFTPELIRSVFGKIDASEWKRRQASPGIRVTSHAFGNGRKVPIGHGYRG